MLMTMSMLILIIFVIFNLNYNKNVLFISNLLFFMSFMYLLNLNFFSLWINISMLMSINYYSFILILLTFWIFGIVVMLMNKEIFKVNLSLIMMLILIFNFLSMNIMIFYFMFEVSLIFIFYLIVKWGLGIMRLSAGFYLMFYTLFFSLPLLMIMIYLVNLVGVESFMMFEYYSNMMENLNNMYMLYLLGAFLVKLPMFMMHNWLLKAHVEAPVYGSMILAALMLKLGSYGLLRFILIFYLNLLNLDFMLIYGLMGGIILSILCFRQLDMKVLVAMSSVVHMNLLMSSMFTMFKMGMLGCYLMMIAHGLCSSGMFYMLNLCYIETNSRLLMFNKGLMIFIPSMSLMWFLICSSNMAAPLSLNLVSEIFMLMSIVLFFNKIMILLGFYCLMSFMYSVYFFSYINHGNQNVNIYMKSSKVINYLILMMHWIPLNFSILNLDMYI